MSFNPKDGIPVKPRQVLEGLKVLDFSWVQVVPITTRYLADYGAEVLKIESTVMPDFGRVTSPFKDGIPGFNRNVLLGWGNGSKKSMCLNLNHPRGLDIAKRLVLWADVVTESFAPGTMGKWGLTYEDIKRIKPDIIMLSSTVFGQTGPYRIHPGFGWNINALAGFTEFTGWPDREAVGPNFAYPDLIAPWFNIVAILAALDYKRRTGQGQYIDQSQFEASLLFLSDAILDFGVNGRQQTRAGNFSPYAAPHGVYRCKGEERWCAIAVSTDDEWEAFRSVIGNPPWTGNASFSTMLGRIQNSQQLDKLVEDWTINHLAEEVMDMMQAAGVPAGVVQNAEDICSDPALESRGHFVLVDHPVIGPFPQPNWPARLSKSAPSLQRAPLMGEHTEYVCTKILGMSDDEFVELMNAGVFT
jgi:benzylsuccinate CoA-transferase BbsF subunit